MANYEVTKRWFSMGAAGKIKPSTPFCERFNRWRLQVAKTVTISSYRIHPWICQQVEQFLNLRNDLHPQRCFDNALSLSKFNSKFDYVEGFYQLKHDDHLGSEHPHGWNYYDGTHFDLTVEVGRQVKITDEKYLKVVRLPAHHAICYSIRSPFDLSVEAFNDRELEAKKSN